MSTEMLTERSIRDSQIFFDGSLNRLNIWQSKIDEIAMISVSSSLPPLLSSAPSSPSSSSPISVFYHRVSKMDTLAGVAIKYGVEIADIKRLNGLVTDLQMFAHKSLQIPLPGRHPPSPLTNGSTNNGVSSSPRRPRNEVFDLIVSFDQDSTPRKVSPAMSRLQGYYGLSPTKQRLALEGDDMAAPCQAGRHSADGVDFDSPTYDPPRSRHRKSRSLASGLTLENCEDRETPDAAAAAAAAAENGEGERSVRRRQRSDGGRPFFHSPDPSLQEGNDGGSSGRTGKGMIVADQSSLAAVRKSSSASCLLQDSDGNHINPNSKWPRRKWSSKPDVLPRRSWFDGFSMSINGVRLNKAARD